MNINLDGKIEIQPVDDGFIVKHIFWRDDASVGKKIYDEEISLIKEDDIKKAIEELLYFIAGKYGFRYDKFSKENINIRFDKKGHKAEDDEE